MEKLYELACSAPGERLAVFLLVFFISLLVVAIRAFWNRNRELKRELNAVHDLQRSLIAGVLGSKHESLEFHPESVPPPETGGHSSAPRARNAPAAPGVVAHGNPVGAGPAGGYL